MPNKFVGHICLRLLGPTPVDSPELREAAVKAAAAFREDVKPLDYLFQYELGSENGQPHAHYYLEVTQSRNTIVTALKKHFKLLDDVSGGPRAQKYSMKAFDETKGTEYFVYLAKGITGKHGDDIVTLLAKVDRPWQVLHEAYHAKAEEIRSARKRKTVSEDFYVTLAEKCKEKRYTSKEDVLSVVVDYYVEDSKKGFESYAVQRAFWRVFSLVNGAEAKSLLTDQMRERLFRI